MFEKEMVPFKTAYEWFNTTTYESNMPFALRFMIDNDIVGMQWIQIQGGKYVLRKPS
jgi:DNA polymerase delta subunit 1